MDKLDIQNRINEVTARVATLEGSINEMVENRQHHYIKNDIEEIDRLGAKINSARDEQTLAEASLTTLDGLLVKAVAAEADLDKKQRAAQIKALRVKLQRVYSKLDKTIASFITDHHKAGGLLDEITQAGGDKGKDFRTMTAQMFLKPLEVLAARLPKQQAEALHNSLQHISIAREKLGDSTLGQLTPDFAAVYSFDQEQYLADKQEAQIKFEAEKQTEASIAAESMAKSLANKYQDSIATH
jgi:hypothetical protein